MGYKTLAIIHGGNNQYRICKWNDKHRTAVGEISRPAKIQVREPDGGGWDTLSRWSAAKTRRGHKNKSDKPVMEEGLNRLKTAFAVDPDRIVYDQCLAQGQVEPDGVPTETL